MLAYSAAPPFPSRPTLLGPAGVPQMFVLFLLLQEKYPKEGEKRGTPPFPTPASVRGAYNSIPAPERCILWHPSTRCRAASHATYRSHPPGGKCSLIPPLRLSPAGPRCWARLGTSCLAGSTKSAWPGAVQKASCRELIFALSAAAQRRHLARRSTPTGTHYGSAPNGGPAEAQQSGFGGGEAEQRNE